MKIVIEYDEETGHVGRAWVFPDDAVAARFFAYARNTRRLDCDLIPVEDPVRQLLDWLQDRRPTEDEEEAYRYWQEGAPPGRPVETIHLPPTLEEETEQRQDAARQAAAYLGKAMGASPAEIAKRMCMTPGDCPNGPNAHPFVAPELALMCCCRQPWEDA